MVRTTFHKHSQRKVADLGRNAAEAIALKIRSRFGAVSESE